MLSKALRERMISAATFPGAEQLLRALWLPICPSRRELRQLCERLAVELRAVGADGVTLEEQPATAKDSTLGGAGGPEIHVTSAELWLHHSDQHEELLLRSSESPDAILGALRATADEGELFELFDVGDGQQTARYRRCGQRMLVHHGNALELAYVEGLAARKAPGLICGPAAAKTLLPERRFFGDHRPFAFRLPRAAFDHLTSQPFDRIKLRCVINARASRDPLPLLRATVGAGDAPRVTLLFDQRGSPWCFVLALSMIRAWKTALAEELFAQQPSIELIFAAGTAGSLGWLARHKGPTPVVVQIAADEQLAVRSAGPAGDYLHEKLAAVAPVGANPGRLMLPSLARSGSELVGIGIPLGASDWLQTRTLTATLGAATAQLALLEPGDAGVLLATAQLRGSERLLAHGRRLGETTAPGADDRHLLHHVEHQLGLALAQERARIERCARLVGGEVGEVLNYAETKAALAYLAETLQRMVSARIRARAGDPDLVARKRPLTALERRASRVRLDVLYSGPLADASLLALLPLSERRFYLQHRAQLPPPDTLLDPIRDGDAESNLLALHGLMELAGSTADLRLLWRFSEALMQAGVVALHEQLHVQQLVPDDPETLG